MATLGPVAVRGLVLGLISSIYLLSTLYRLSIHFIFTLLIFHPACQGGKGGVGGFDARLTDPYPLPIHLSILYILFIHLLYTIYPLSILYPACQGSVLGGKGVDARFTILYPSSILSTYPHPIHTLSSMTRVCVNRVGVGRV